ncbi:unnamed protein product [Leptosia nina]|uniref:Uncharacterized protein n=1 Tax=Leptosia nina TaxID=320188 RepID=A0AAV1JQY3_9NEOP
MVLGEMIGVKGDTIADTGRAKSPVHSNDASWLKPSYCSTVPDPSPWRGTPGTQCTRAAQAHIMRARPPYRLTQVSEPRYQTAKRESVSRKSPVYKNCRVQSNNS